MSLLLALAVAHGLGSDACKQTAVINLSFRTDGQAPLPGVSKDMERFKTYFNPGKGATLDLPSVNLEHFPGGKRGLLERIRKTIADYPNVQFNYGGHGIQTLDMDEMDRVASLRPPPKPIKMAFSASGKPTYPTPDDADDEPALSPSPPDPRIADAENKFALETSECHACKLKCTRTDTKACVAKNGGGRENENACWSRATKDYASACSRDCLEKWCITKSDLEKLFAGKNVFGVLDTCHSAAIKGFKNPKHEFMISTLSPNEKASDTTDGGTISKAMLDGIDPCRMPSASGDHLDAQDLNSQRKKGFYSLFVERANTSERPSAQNCYVSLAGMKCPGAKRSGESGAESSR